MMTKLLVNSNTTLRFLPRYNEMFDCCKLQSWQQCCKNSMEI